MKYADDAKIKILNWILQDAKSNEVIGSELHFHDGKYRADLVVASDTRLCAIEVKSPKDDLRRLLKQLSGYQKMFLEVYIAVSATHIKNTKKLVPENTGILLLEDGSVSVEKKAKVRKNLSQDEALAWLRTEDLRKLVKGTNTKKNLDDLRNAASSRLNKTQLSEAALKSVTQRLQFRFSAFQHERGKQIILDDLKMLQIPEFIF